MCYNEVSVENEIILGIFAEKGPYNMTMWFVVHLIVTDTYVELTRPKIESCDPIFFTGTRARLRVFRNDRLFPHGSKFGPDSEIPASPVVQLWPRPVPVLQNAECD